MKTRKKLRLSMTPRQARAVLSAISSVDAAGGAHEACESLSTEETENFLFALSQAHAIIWTAAGEKGIDLMEEDIFL